MVESRTESSGEYRLCNLEAGDGVTLLATFGRNQALPVEISQRGTQMPGHLDPDLGAGDDHRHGTGLG